MRGVTTTRRSSSVAAPRLRLGPSPSPTTSRRCRCAQRRSARKTGRRTSRSDGMASRSDWTPRKLRAATSATRWCCLNASSASSSAKCSALLFFSGRRSSGKKPEALHRSAEGGALRRLGGRHECVEELSQSLSTTADSIRDDGLHHLKAVTIVELCGWFLIASPGKLCLSKSRRLAHASVLRGASPRASLHRGNNYRGGAESGGNLHRKDPSLAVVDNARSPAAVEPEE